MICIDMDVPKNCDDCRFFMKDISCFNFCTASKDDKNLYNIVKDESVRAEWCPLKEQKGKVHTESNHSIYFEGEYISKKEYDSNVIKNFLGKLGIVAVNRSGNNEDWFIGLNHLESEVKRVFKEEFDSDIELLHRGI